jgi:hypothetical protein
VTLVPAGDDCGFDPALRLSPAGIEETHVGNEFNG